jgi:Flp pilus assembly protein TadD
MPLALAGTLMLGACSSGLGTATGSLASLKPEPAADQRSELVKATEFWGQKYQQNPRDLTSALNYAKNLKAMGEKQRALGVLQQMTLLHSDSRELASEYGRLALELDQVSVAARLLAAADDPVNPDWKIISARGTVLAKQGKYDEAVPFYERALTLAPNQPSVLSNLALAHAMNGDAAKAETMLRQAAAADRSSLKIRQNLAIVMGLQGKYDEAKLLASSDLSPENAAENTDAIRKIVKLEQKPLPAAKARAKVTSEPAVPPLPVAKPAMTEPTKPSPAPKLPFSFEVARWSSTTTVARAKAPAPKMIAAVAGSKPHAGKTGEAKQLAANAQVAKAPAAKAPATKTEVAESPLEIMLAAAKTLAAKATAMVEQDIKVASAIATPERNPVRKVTARAKKGSAGTVIAAKAPATTTKAPNAKALASAMARGARVAARAAATSKATSKESASLIASAENAAGGTAVPVSAPAGTSLLAFGQALPTTQKIAADSWATTEANVVAVKIGGPEASSPVPAKRPR